MMVKKHISTTMNFTSNSLMEKEKITETLNPFSDNHIQDLQQMESLMITKILTQDDWIKFKKQFIKLYPFFFTNLKVKGILLTKSEERLLALEYLNLNSEEIATKLGISDRSVIMSRYRLRKKIKAPKNIPILEYINSKN